MVVFGDEIFHTIHNFLKKRDPFPLFFSIDRLCRLISLFLFVTGLQWRNPSPHLLVSFYFFYLKKKAG